MIWAFTAFNLIFIYYYLKSIHLWSKRKYLQHFFSLYNIVKGCPCGCVCCSRGGVTDTLETKLACFWFFPWRVFSKIFLHHSLSQLIPILLLNFFLFPISFFFFTLVPFSVYLFIFLLKLNLDQPTVVLRCNTKKIVGVSLICMILFYPRAWVWVNSGSWWWTGRPGMLQFMGLQQDTTERLN